MEPKAPIILTVDDESSVRRVIRTVLEREGYSVREASCGTEAIATFESEPDIALVLSDMRMPGMDGNALGHALTALRPKVRLMFISAFDQELDERFRHCATLNKPFNNKQLVARVRSQLNLAACA